MVKFFWDGHLYENQHGSWLDIVVDRQLNLCCVNDNPQQGNCHGRLHGTIGRVNEHGKPFAERHGPNNQDWIVLIDAEFVGHAPTCAAADRALLDAHNFVRISAVRRTGSSASSASSGGNHGQQSQQQQQQQCPTPTSQRTFYTFTEFPSTMPTVVTIRPPAQDMPMTFEFGRPINLNDFGTGVPKEQRSQQPPPQ